MKTKKSLLIILICSVVLVACKKDPDIDDPTYETKTYIIDFEDVKLDESLGFWDGSDETGEMLVEETAWGSVTNYYGHFLSGIGQFKNVFSPSDWGGSWMGFACSNHTDIQTIGIGNQYSVVAGKGAEQSAQFGIAYSDSATLLVPKNEIGYYTIKSLKMTNSTYAYQSMKDGDSYTKKFNSTDGDWFKVTIIGYKNNTTVGVIDYYLADFRDGRNFIAKEWENVDVSALGEVDRISFLFNSTDVGEYGMNNPAYVCIDNIEFEQVVKVTN